MSKVINTKTLGDIQADMSELYEAVQGGKCDLKTASELANITGKYLKAVQLEFAKEVFLDRQTLSQRRLEDAS